MRGLPLILAVAVSACTPTAITTTDFGVVLEGCRIPEACFTAQCACNRGQLQQTPSNNGCLVCDPLTQGNLQCICDADVDGGVGGVCRDPSQVCIGRAAQVCPGIGARCLPAGSSCSGSAESESPPQLVAAVRVDGGEPALEPHCAFADDVCCPGTDDMGVPDLAETD